jgi:predicted peroxiredoxin
MPRLRGLTIIVATADPARFHAALSLASAQAALGRRARLYLHGEAVALLGPGSELPGYAEAGLPGIADLQAEAVALGVTITACQSGFVLAGLRHADIGSNIEAGGLIELITGLDDDRLVVI